MHTHPAMIIAFLPARERDQNRLPRRTAAPPKRAYRAHDGEAADRSSDELVFRMARCEDASGLSRLGQLEAGTRYGLRLAALARSPEHGSVLVAEANGVLVAALDVRQNRVVADPFQRSKAARELLEVRSRQLRGLGDGAPQPARRWTARLLPRAG